VNQPGQPTTTPGQPQAAAQPGRPATAQPGQTPAAQPGRPATATAQHTPGTGMHSSGAFIVILHRQGAGHETNPTR
jgi:hypothetical protein